MRYLTIIFLLSLIFISSCNIKNDDASLVCNSDKDCVKSGCSGEVCVKKGAEITTACLYLEEYQCLKYLPCSCINSKCSFKENDEHLICLDNLKK